VSGKFSFSQDVIYSKLTTENMCLKKPVDFHRLKVKTYTFDAPLVLIRNEIINGVITQPILELLQKVCSNS